MKTNLLALVVWIAMLLPRAAVADDAPVEHDGSRGLWLRNELAEVFLAVEPRFRVMAFRKIGETSLMMALCPEAVEMEKFGDNKGWYTATARDASAELGRKGRDLILAHLRAVLTT